MSVAKSSVPPLSTRVPTAVPNALVLPSFKVPPVSVVAPPVRALGVLNAIWPLSCFVKLYAPVSAPNVRFVLAAVSKIAPLAENVEVPNVSPTVPLDTLLPAVRLSVCAPMFSVPSVCVIPAPLVARSETIVEFAVTVVLYAVMLLSVAKSSVPPPSDSGAVETPKACVFAAFNVPALIVVVPPYVFVPDSVNMPAPCLVRPPPVLPITPA